MNKNTNLSTEQNYRLSLFALLAGSSLIAIGILVARASATNSYRYFFLVWNLLLAWIPFGFAWVAYTSRKLPKFLLDALIVLCAALWLIFFPNAPYILTDFQHLANQNTEAPVWYDVIMLLWFSWNGLLLGIISLYFMQRIVTRIFGIAPGWIFVTVVTALTSLGIYLGRFLRWNSWDVVSNPQPLIYDILDRFIHPLNHPRTLTFTFLFTLFFLFLYATILVFGHLINAQQPGE
jgi:uncharacterized membrane protein